MAFFIGRKKMAYEVVRDIKTGDKVRLTEDFYVGQGKFTKGHEFTVTGRDASWFYFLKDGEGRKVGGVSSSYFELV